MSTTRARRVLAAAMVAVGLGMVAACTGVPVDESPEAISRSELPPQLLPSSTTTTVRPGEGDLVSVFLVRGSSTSDDALVNTLVAIPTVDTADLPAAVLEHLIRNEPNEQHKSEGLGSDIPSTVSLRSVDQDGGRVTLDVTGLQDVESIKQRIAVAQIVFTLTAIDGVDEVVILSEGQPRSLTTELGGSQAGEPLTREKHFPTLSARLNPNAPSTTTTVVVQAPSTSVP